LQAALLPSPQLERALERWRGSTSLERLDYSTLTILPLLYRNLLRHQVASDLRERLSGVYRWSWHRNQLLLARLERAIASLRDAGVETLTIKGVPLAIRTYGDLGARVMGDADLVVRRDAVERALDALESAGWRAERPITEQLLASLGGVNLRDRQGRVIDLHWHILLDSYDVRRDEALWQAADTIHVGREPVRSLTPTDHLLEVVAHGLSWAANPPLHWVADAVMLLRTEQSELDWTRLLDQATANRRVPALRDGLRYLATVFDAPVPAPVLDRLEALPVDPAQRVAFWLAGHSGPGWPWGRAPLVAASYMRASRAHGRRPGVRGFLRFVGTRADCTPARWLVQACIDGLRHARRSLSIALSRVREVQAPLS